MLKIDINLSSRPFVNNRRFYLTAGLLLTLLGLVSYWNFYRYQSTHSRRGEFNQQLYRDRARFETLGEEQEQLMARLQTADTAEFLDQVEYINALIERRTFSWTLLLNDLEKVVPPNLQIVSIRPQLLGKEIRIEIVASARSSRDAIQFIGNLESSGQFYDVSPLYEDISKNPAFVGREIGVSVKYRAV